MKEIDLLPEWYKSGRRRQHSYRTQYIVLCGLFAVIMVWSFTASHSISKVKAALAESGLKGSATADLSEEFAKIKGQIEKLQETAAILNKIDSRIDVADVLAEISFLIGEKVVLSKVEFTAERLMDNPAGNSRSRKATAVRIAGARSAGGRSPAIGSVRFKIMIGGLAPDSGEVAELVCRLEESPYFCQVYPLFSRSTEVKVRTADKQEALQASKFEIVCYLANYTELRVNS